MIPELGIIEGYFGMPWSHDDRKHVATEARRLGYSFFHYAPKADAFLRRRWREPHPHRRVGRACRAVVALPRPRHALRRRA